MNNERSLEITPSSSSSRRKFVFRIGALSVLTAMVAAIKFPAPLKKNVIACKPETNPHKMKLLTQDGKLVEIDESLVSANKRKITDEELQHWVKNKKSSH
ncbi:MAG TPA: hypothetical protein VMT76_16750 [Puia sp.]|nr:hypothetical protein [Puia sp.]